MSCSQFSINRNTHNFMGQTKMESAHKCIKYFILPNKQIRISFLSKSIP